MRLDLGVSCRDNMFDVLLIPCSVETWGVSCSVKLWETDLC